ncbi:MAG TPA: AraC family transcriptional regulator [Desulfobulbaceae bacterium]|nr:AraC family transcriptional regulator [Desulfobulbaceae bacterium]
MTMTKLASAQLVLWNICKAYSQDPEAIFRTAHLDPDLMYQPGTRYSLQKIALLWAEAARRIKDPCFGLAAATNWHPTHFGTLGYALLMSKSLRITLERLLRFHKVLSEARFGKIHEDKDKGTLVFTLTYLDEEPYPPGREDAALAWIMSTLRINFHHNLTPASVCFTHGRPACAGKYYEFFQGPITFDAPAAGLALPLNLVDVLLPGANEELAEFNDQAMSQYLTLLDDDTWATRVRKVITEHLPSGAITVEKAASELHISTRKLQRLLKEEGTTFLALLNATRMKLAKEYVHTETMDLTEIAFLLGFSELSTFSRSFKRWTGQSPIQYRNAA